jgi:hypothetical protein
MRVIRKSLDISTPGATYNLTYEPPKGARVAVIGVGVDSLASLYDTQVMAITHGARQGVKTKTISSVEYGVPLGHVASRVEHDSLSSVPLVAAPQVRMWPGRMNDPRDLANLRAKLRNGGSLDYHENLRLRWADRAPCRSFAMWPLRELVEFKISLSRVFGTTAISRAWLYLLEFEDAREHALYCGQPDLTDYPMWVAQPLILDAAAGVDRNPHETQWPGEFSGINPHGLRIKQFFSTGYSRDPDADNAIAYAPTYPNLVKVELQRGDAGALAPWFAEERVTLSEFAPQLMQHFDCWRDPELILPWYGSLLWDTERLLSSLPKIIRVSAYGLLRPQADGGSVYDTP